MKALSLTVQKIWPMLKLLQTQTDVQAIDYICPRSVDMGAYKISKTKSDRPTLFFFSASDSKHIFLIFKNLFIYSFFLLALQTEKAIMKSLPCKCLEYKRCGAYWRQDKSGFCFTNECVKRTQIANPERTQKF
jgi:hypothetical protein